MDEQKKKRKWGDNNLSNRSRKILHPLVQQLGHPHSKYRGTGSQGQGNHESNTTAGAYLGLLHFGIVGRVQRIGGERETVPRDRLVVTFNGGFVTNSALFANDKLVTFAAIKTKINRCDKKKAKRRTLQIKNTEL